jgi:hypothetical protein
LRERMKEERVRKKDEGRVRVDFRASGRFREWM